MHCLAVGKHYNTEPATACLFYAGPSSDTAVCLLAFVLGPSDYPGNPRVTDFPAVMVSPDDIEIFCRFHPLDPTTLCLAVG